MGSAGMEPCTELETSRRVEENSQALDSKILFYLVNGERAFLNGTVFCLSRSFLKMVAGDGGWTAVIVGSGIAVLALVIFASDAS